MVAPTGCTEPRVNFQPSDGCYPARRLRSSTACRVVEKPLESEPLATWVWISRQSFFQRAQRDFGRDRRRLTLVRSGARISGRRRERCAQYPHATAGSFVVCPHLGHTITRPDPCWIVLNTFSPASVSLPGRTSPGSTVTFLGMDSSELSPNLRNCHQSQRAPTRRALLDGAVEWIRTTDLLITNQLFKALIYFDARQGALTDLRHRRQAEPRSKSGVPAESTLRLNTTKMLLMLRFGSRDRYRCCSVALPATTCKSCIALMLAKSRLMAIALH